MAYELIDEGRGFFVRQTGHVTFDEIAEVNDLLLSHDKWDSHEYQIWSYLDAWAVEGDTRDGRVISRVDNMSLGKSHETPIKVAFVSTNSKTNEVITSYIATVDPERVKGRLFRTEADARAWIGH